MTNTEYVQESENLKAQLADLLKRFLLQAPFHPGDKVIVTETNGAKTLCSVVNVKEPDFFNRAYPDRDVFLYNLVKVKKDGTPSWAAKHFHPFFGDTIEKA